jgi:hypothetical protein
MKEKEKESIARLVSMGQQGDGTRWDMEELRQILRNRIEQHMTGGAHSLRRAFRVFSKRETVITYPKFKETLIEIGMIMPNDQMMELFGYYDSNSNGQITFDDFTKEVMDETVLQATLPGGGEFMRAEDTRLEAAKVVEEERTKQALEDRGHAAAHEGIDALTQYFMATDAPQYLDKQARRKWNDKARKVSTAIIASQSPKNKANAKRLVSVSRKIRKEAKQQQQQQQEEEDVTNRRALQQQVQRAREKQREAKQRLHTTTAPLQRPGTTSALTAARSRLTPRDIDAILLSRRSGLGTPSPSARRQQLDEQVQRCNGTKVRGFILEPLLRPRASTAGPTAGGRKRPPPLAKPAKFLSRSVHYGILRSQNTSLKSQSPVREGP